MRKLILAAIVAAAFSIPAFAAQTTPATSAPAAEAEAIAGQVRETGARAMALASATGEGPDLLVRARALCGRLDTFVDLTGDHDADVGADLAARTIRLGTAPTSGDRIIAPDTVPAALVADTVQWLCLPVAGSARGPVTVDLSAA